LKGKQLRTYNRNNQPGTGYSKTRGMFKARYNGENRTTLKLKASGGNTGVGRILSWEGPTVDFQGYLKMFSEGDKTGFTRGSQIYFCRRGQKWHDFILTPRNEENNPILQKN